MKKIFVVWILLAGFCSNGLVAKPKLIYSPDVLQQILDQAAARIAAGEQVGMIFDLDDTVFGTAARNVVIFREFAASVQNQKKYAKPAQRLSQIGTSDILWGVGPTFRKLGIRSQPFVAEATQFWGKRFFTSEYAALDPEIPGASDFLRKVQRMGVKIFYITGRDRPRMRNGTLLGLQNRKFPLPGRLVKLMMKPDFETKDIDFKIPVFAEISRDIEVIAAFENEPANANAYADAFPNATVLLVDTMHSDKPVVLTARAKCIRDLLLTKPSSAE